jgi:hypothetical protein
MGKAYGYGDEQANAAAEIVCDALRQCKSEGVPTHVIVMAALGEVYSLSEEVVIEPTDGRQGGQ